jgi:hypothetical protein
VRSLHVCGEPLVVKEIGIGCVRKIGECGLEPGHQIQMRYPVKGVVMTVLFIGGTL